MIDTGKVAFDIALEAVEVGVVLMGLVIGPRDLEHTKVCTLTSTTGEGVVDENIFKDGFYNSDDGVMEDAVDEGRG